MSTDKRAGWSAVGGRAGDTNNFHSEKIGLCDKPGRRFLPSFPSRQEHTEIVEVRSPFKKLVVPLPHSVRYLLHLLLCETNVSVEVEVSKRMASMGFEGFIRKR